MKNGYRIKDIPIHKKLLDILERHLSSTLATDKQSLKAIYVKRTLLY